MEQINKYRSPIVLGVLVLFLLLFAFFLLGFQPTNSKIAEQESEMSQLEQQNSLMENKIEELNRSAENDGLRMRFWPSSRAVTTASSLFSICEPSEQ